MVRYTILWGILELSTLRSFDNPLEISVPIRSPVLELTDMVLVRECEQGSRSTQTLLQGVPGEVGCQGEILSILTDGE